MKYNGMKLNEFKSDKPVMFDPPKKMLVWDENIEVREDLVYAYIPKRFVYKVIGHSCAWTHCAEIPKEPKPRRATNRELAKWLAQGNGMCKHRGGVTFHTCILCGMSETDTECASTYLIQKWDDTEWHEPTVDYMGLEE